MDEVLSVLSIKSKAIQRFLMALTFGSVNEMLKWRSSSTFLRYLKMYNIVLTFGSG